MKASFTVISFLLFLNACTGSKQLDAVLGSQNEEDVGNPALAFTPGNYNFGNVRASADAAVHDITVTNSSGKVVYLNSIEGENSHFQILTHSCPSSPSSFNPGQTCEVRVRFKPLNGGILSMGLSVNYGKSIDSFPFYSSTAITGNGVTPLIFPGITQVDQIQCSTARVHWDEVAGAGAYLVFAEGSGSSQLVGSISNSDTYNVTNLNAATTYTFRVYATDLLGVTATNSAVQVATTAPGPQLPSVTNPVFPNDYILQDSPVPTLDFYNQNTNNDTNMSYSCYYDRIIDGEVSTTNACTALPGLATFNSTTGIFNWTPSTDAVGAYELKVTGSLYGECASSRIVLVNVKENFTMTNQLAYWDAFFARIWAPNLNSPLSTTWRNIASSGSAYDGTLNAGTWNAQTWAGLGTVQQPFSLSLDSNNSNYVTFSGNYDAQNAYAFNMWVKPAPISQADKAILGNGGESGDGFLLKTSADDAGKLELHMGSSNASNYYNIVMTKSPVGYWKLDESTGNTAADSSGNNLNGSLGTSVVLNQSSEVSVGKSFGFVKNSNSFVNVDDHNLLDITGDISISAWVYPTSSSGYQGLVAKGNGTGGYPYLWAFDNGTLFHTLYLSTTNATWSKRATTAATLNQWNHLAVTYDHTTGVIQYYVNGSPAGNYTVTPGTLASTSRPLEIGNMIDKAYPLEGKMDEVAIFDRVLTPAEVTDLSSKVQNCISSTSLSSDSWYFVSGLLDQMANTVQMYINGSLECSIQSNQTLSPAAAPLTLGAKSDGTQAWSGNVSLLNFYSSLSPTDLSDMYYMTVKRFRETPSITTRNLALYLDAGLPNGISYNGSGCSPSTWNDLSSNAHVGTLYNFSSCGASNGWNGTNSPTNPYTLNMTRASADQVRVPHHTSLDITSDLSITVVLKPTGSIANYKGILGKGDGGPNYGYQLALFDGSWRPSLYLDGANSTWSNTATTPLTVDAWNVVTVTFESATKSLRYYLNGSPDGSYTTSGATYGSNPDYLEIGSIVTNIYSFEGGIRAVMINSTTLTPTEVKNNCRAYLNTLSGLSCAP